MRCQRHPLNARESSGKIALMPEQYRRPRHHEMVELVERMRRTREAEQDALLIVRHFNARLSTRRSAGFWPTISSAMRAKHHWMQILCESCGGITDLDLRMKPRDPDASVRVALRDACCPRCNGHGRPRIVGLAQRPSI
jgi:hypothetical protein